MKKQRFKNNLNKRQLIFKIIIEIIVKIEKEGLVTITISNIENYFPEKTFEKC